MTRPDHPTFLLRRLQGRLKQLATRSPVLAASFGTYTHRCGRPSCRCHHGGPLHRGQHLTFKEHGKTRSVYVPKALLPEVRSWLAEHKRLKALLHEIHLLTVALLRARARLLRMKALDAARLLGHPVLLVDATGLLCFPQRHCPHCLVQRHGKRTLYFHHVLEAKLLGPAGVVVSLGSEFIENADAADARGKSAEEVKQDCELKALHRLLPRIKKDHPQLPFVLALDSLYGCGPVFALARQFGW